MKEPLQLLKSRDSTPTTLPAEWGYSQLSDCGEIVMGQSPPGSSYNKSGIGSALINGPTEFTDRWPIKIQWTTQPARFCHSGDLLICVRGSSTGRTNYANDAYAIGRGVAAIRAKGSNVTAYLSYQVIAGVAGILASAAGSTFPSVDGGTFRRISVLLPPPEEQLAIAEALSDVDRLLGALESLIAKKRAIKQAAMQQLLTGKTRLPGFSGDWGQSTVGKEFHIQLGKMLDASRNTGVAKFYVGNAAVQWGQIDTQHLPTVPMTPNDIARFRLRSGDLLVCEGGEVGRSAIWDEPIPECYFQKAIHCLRPADGYEPQLLMAYLQHWSANGGLVDYVTQTSIAHLPKERFETIPLLKPSAAEQRAITAVLSDMDAEITALERRRDKTRAIKQGMMQQLLTGKIRIVK